MVWIIVLFIVVGLILFAIQLIFRYWFITVPLAFVVMLVYIYKNGRKLKKERETTEKQRALEIRTAEENRVRCYNETQKRYWNEILKSVQNAASLFEEIPQYLLKAEQNLDRAQADYHEGVFAPFWDSIERAILKLGKSDEKIKNLNDCLASYAHAAAEYKGTFPAFPVNRNDVDKLSDASVGTQQRV